MAGSSTVVRPAIGIWLLGVLGAAAVAHWLLPDDPQAGLFAMGLLCMGYTLAAFALARRETGITALLPLAWTAAFGMWLPIGQDFGQDTIAPALAGSGVAQAIIEPLANAIVLAVGGVATGAMLYLGTASAAVFWHALLLTALVAGTSLSHHDTPTTTFAAAIAWHAGVAGSLMRWASHAYWAARQGVCPRCSEDIRGVGSGSCPSCKLTLVCHSAARSAVPSPPKRPSSPNNRAA